MKNNVVKRRRDFLPIWIKFFTIFFLFGGLLSSVMLIVYLFGHKPDFEIYGFNGRTNYPYSFFVVFLSFALNFIVAYNLWFEKRKAIYYAIVNAKIGIAFCLISFFIDLVNDKIMFRIEILFLLLFIFHLKKIKENWESFNYQK